MRYIGKILLCLLFIFVGVILYTHRALYTSRFDAAYWKDKYEHSQWKLPLSPRTIGDDGLYLYEGYRLIHGDDPTTMNAEVPPLGKYLIGLSIVGLGNGHWFGFITTLGAFAALYLLARVLLSSRLYALGTTLLFALDPLIAGQFHLTMLDSLQMAFGLLTLWMLTKIVTSTKRQETSKTSSNSLVAGHLSLVSLLLLGLFFGLFAATKAPIFSPFMALTIAITLLFVYKSILPHIIVFTTTTLTYTLTYLPYFFMGHTLIDWFKVQKWILMFYRGSYIEPNIGSALTTLLFNKYQNLFSHVWERPSHFSFTWPLIVGLSVVAFILLVMRRTSAREKLTFFPVTSFLVMSLGFLSIIPFWTRYLLPVLPLLYILAVYAGKQLLYKKVFALTCVALFVANSVALVPVLFPTPEGTVKQALYAWKQGFFHDLYEELAISSRTTDRKTFHAFGLATYNDGEIEAVDITLNPIPWKRFAKTQHIPIRITYKTRNLGLFTEDRLIPVVKERGRWKIEWNWNLLIDGLAPEHTLATTVAPAKRGTIILNDVEQTSVAQDIRTVRISVIPNDIDKTQEEKMFKMLETLFEGRASAVSMHQRAVGNSLGDEPISMGVLPFALDANLRKDLLSYPGILLTGAYSRQWSPSGGIDVGKVANTQYKECCSYLYNTTTYDGVSGLEKQYNDTLKGYNGGSLVIKDETGKVVQTLISVEKRDGGDVQLQ